MCFYFTIAAVEEQGEADCLHRRDRHYSSPLPAGRATPGGLHWLQFASIHGTDSILDDELWLGKIMQTITFFYIFTLYREVGTSIATCLDMFRSFVKLDALNVRMSRMYRYCTSLQKSLAVCMTTHSDQSECYTTSNFHYCEQVINMSYF